MSIENRGENKWRFRIRKDGINYTQNFYGTEKEAKKAHNIFLADVERGKVGINENMTFNELYELYMNEYVRTNLRFNSSISYNSAYKAFSDLKKLQIAKIKTIQIQQIVNKLNHNLSAGTVKTYFSRIKAIFSKAITWDIIVKNPCDNVVLNKVIKNNLNEIISAENLHRMISLILDVKNKQHKIIYLLALFGGLREGEVCGITIDNIDFSERSIKIDKQYTFVKKTEHRTKVYDFAPLKTHNSERTVYFPSFVFDILKKYTDGIIIPMNKAIFCTRNNKVVEPRYISETWGKFSKKHNLNINYHKLRHLNATLLLQNGATIVDVAANLGDTVATASANYLHDFTATRKDNADRLNEFALNLPNVNIK